MGGFSGNITGPGSVLISAAAGHAGPDFSGVNTYTGATIVQSGGLDLDGPLNSSSLYDVKNGASLQFSQNTILNLGSGQIVNEAGGFISYFAVMINGGSIRGPGDSTVRTMTLNGTTIESDATFPDVPGLLTLNNATLAGTILAKDSPTTSTVFNGGTITSSGRLTIFRAQSAASNSLESDG